MGAWGIKALESDAGLDVVDFLEDFYKGKSELSLSEMLSVFVDEGFLGKDEHQVDFYFDNTAMALAELYLMFQKEGVLKYGDKNEVNSLRNKESFVANAASLDVILKHLMDIKNEKPGKYGEREYVELWKESPSYEEWNAHLEYLIIELTKELK